MAPFRLIVGLGNPGGEYAETRHNVGFMVLDRLAARAGATFKAEKKWQAIVASTGNGWLCKPQTYMNLSGESVSALGHFYKIEPSQVLVVLDDLALPLGRLRLREKGSAGGHNGLKSIQAMLGNQQYSRLRIGIHPGEEREVGNLSDFVLGQFGKTETKIVKDLLPDLTTALEMWLKEGITPVMNKYPGK